MAWHRTMHCDGDGYTWWQNPSPWWRSRMSLFSPDCPPEEGSMMMVKPFFLKWIGLERECGDVFRLSTWEGLTYDGATLWVVIFSSVLFVSSRVDGKESVVNVKSGHEDSNQVDPSFLSQIWPILSLALAGLFSYGLIQSSVVWFVSVWPACIRRTSQDSDVWSHRMQCSGRPWK